VNVGSPVQKKQSLYDDIFPSGGHSMKKCADST
jgi:hypothetical protein